MTGDTVKDHSQICRCLDGATGVNTLNPFRAAIRPGSACGPICFRLFIPAWRSPASARISCRRSADDADSAADLAVEVFAGVARPNFGPMPYGEVIGGCGRFFGPVMRPALGLAVCRVLGVNFV